MNIKITHNWLLDYLETDANPYEIQKYLSLCGPSIEQVEKFNDDYIYDIEIISNRIDYASVIGIAQEAKAILPMFGKKAKLKFDPLKKYKFNSLNLGNKYELRVEIKNPDLCSRFAAVVLDNITVKPSPILLKNRLMASGIKSINNVVDISNFLMLTFGQPVHTFDYDQITKASMIMRESQQPDKQTKNKERIITLDGKEIILPGGDIIIEDGIGRIIDLCGIMGGLNSSINSKTNKVVLFVQTYNKEKIRKTAMSTGQRTVASTYFEKGLDEERVEPTLVCGVELMKKYASGKVSSRLYDIYPKPYVSQNIEIKYSKFDDLIGLKIDRKIIIGILANLGFSVTKKEKSLIVNVPSYRKYDVTIPEDLVEEVARIYGYHKLPNNLQPAAYIPETGNFVKLFSIISKIKYLLKHLGLNEVINYSMISKVMIKDFGLKPESHLKLANSISEEIEFMRINLFPSLLKNIRDNVGKKEILKFFEIGKVYLPRQNDLPEEKYKLGIAVNTNYFDLKGIIEAIYNELNIKEDVEEKVIQKSKNYMVEIDLQKLISKYNLTKTYRPVNPYAVVKLDYTFELSNKTSYKKIKTLSFQSTKDLLNIDFISLYNNKLGLRFYFSSTQKNITEEEALKQLKKITLLIKSTN